jgi:tetratricopeptide (TPR) repeat protein
MDDDLREQIYNDLNLRETKELVEIWQRKNLDEWQEEAFDIIKGILLERLGYVPIQSTQVQIDQILRRVDSSLQAGDLDKALSECELAIKMAPDFALAYQYRGLIYDEMGQLEKAIADFQETVRLDPELEDTWDYLKSVERDLEVNFQQSSTRRHLDQALAYAYNDVPDKALEECELARRAMPGIALAYNYLGLILEELEEVESAIDVYLEAIRLNPRFYAARENLANARVRLEEAQYGQDIELTTSDNDEEKTNRVANEELSSSGFEESPASGITGNEDVPGWLYMDEKALRLSGWPGHRTRPGRSGYDPLDVDFESAHIGGVIIHSLLTYKFRTYNPFYLVLMTYVGIVACLPLLFGVLGFLNNDWAPVMVMVIYIPYWVVGIALLMNVYLSLGMKKPKRYAKGSNAFF